MSENQNETPLVNIELEGAEMQGQSELVNIPLGSGELVTGSGLVNIGIEQEGSVQSTGLVSIGSGGDGSIHGVNLIDIPVENSIPIPKGYQTTIQCPNETITGRVVCYSESGYMHNIKDLFVDHDDNPLDIIRPLQDTLELYVALQDESPVGEYAHFARIEAGVELEFDVFGNNNIQKGKSVCVFNNSDGMIAQTDTVGSQGYNIGIALESAQYETKTRIRVLCINTHAFDTSMHTQ